MKLVILNIICLIILVFIISLYGLNMKMPYPKVILETFNEPLTRFITYIFLYIICIYNPVLGLISGICILLLHIDYINLFLK